MKLVRFEDINGRETFINPDRVNHISDYGSGTTEINFGDKQASLGPIRRASLPLLL